ncbi:MAG: glycosyltransferase family 4 protein [Opitutae bacterium]|nr:glycosyltransferase family 4 protein [Opitutae bacterium]
MNDLSSAQLGFPRLRPTRGDTPPANPLRLAVDLSHLQSRGASGGVKPFVLEYLRGLAMLEGDNLVFVFLTCTASHSEVRQLARAQDELVCVRDNGGEGPAALGNWRGGETFLPHPPLNLLVQLRADVFYSPLISAEFACQGVPTLATVVDVLHRDYPATLSPESNRHRESSFQKLVRVSAKFQCISHYTAGQMTRHYKIPADQMFCSHVIIHHRFNPVDSARRREAADVPYFLYPANCWPHKNHETLLVAYRLYRRQHAGTPWRLVLTGHESDAMHQLLETAGHLGVREHITFHGHLPEKEFAGLWRDAGALVFPSLHEGFGIPLIEAMHFGIPILSSEMGSLPEVGGDAALYADPLSPVAWAGAMLKIATHPELRAALVARGRRRLGEFSLAAELKEFRDEIRSLAGKPGRRWNHGLHPDGWIEGIAVFGLPASSGNARLEVRVAAGPASRRVRLYRGLTPLGGFDVPAGIAVEHFLEIQPDGQPLVIEVPDADHLDSADHRRHGVLLAAVNLESAGQRLNLMEEAP